MYLHSVAPSHGFFGLALALYLASHGAGKLMWPVWGNVARLLVAGVGGSAALHAGLGLSGVFVAQATGLVVYGAVNASAILAGAWFGPVRWRRANASQSKERAMLAP